MQHQSCTPLTKSTQALTQNVSQVSSSCHAAHEISTMILHILSVMVSRQHRCMRLCLKIVRMAAERTNISSLKTGVKKCVGLSYFQFLAIEKLKIHSFCSQLCCRCFRGSSPGTSNHPCTTSAACLMRTYNVLGCLLFSFHLPLTASLQPHTSLLLSVSQE